MAAAAACLMLAGCGSTLIEPSAASVDGREIPTDEIQLALARFEKCDQFEQATQDRPPNEVKREYEQTLLTRLVRREILTGEAQEAGVEVTLAQVDQRIDQIRADFDSEKAFADELKAQCVTLQEVRAFVKDSELERQLRARVTEGTGPTEEELRAEYEARADEFSEMNVDHILVREKAEADRIYRELQDAPPGKLDQTFARLAKESSIDAGSASRGGSLGYLNPADLVPEFTDAALALDEGQISEPVKTQFGWHLIRLVDVRVRSFEEARDQLAEELGGQEQESAWQDFLERAYSDANVEVNPRFGHLDPDTQQVVNDDADSVPAGQPQPTSGSTPQANN
jgi:foldase protein PrsA